MIKLLLSPKPLASATATAQATAVSEWPRKMPVCLEITPEQRESLANTFATPWFVRQLLAVQFIEDRRNTIQNLKKVNSNILDILIYTTQYMGHFIYWYVLFTC